MGWLSGVYGFVDLRVMKRGKGGRRKRERERESGKMVGFEGFENFEGKDGIRMNDLGYEWFVVI